MFKELILANRYYQLFSWLQSPGLLCHTTYSEFVRLFVRSFVWQSHQKLQFIRYRLSIGLSVSVRLQGGPIDLQSLTMCYAVWGFPHWHRLSSPNPHFTIESPNFPIPVRNLFSWTQAFRRRPCPRNLFDQSWMCGCSLCGIGSS